MTSFIGAIDFRERLGVPPEGQPRSRASLARTKPAYEEAGFRLEAIESGPPIEKIKLGLPGREQELGVVGELVTNMGELGIPV